MTDLVRVYVSFALRLRPIAPAVRSQWEPRSARESTRHGALTSRSLRKCNALQAVRARQYRVLCIRGAETLVDHPGIGVNARALQILL
jgi:hypothetical protein